MRRNSIPAITPHPGNAENQDADDESSEDDIQCTGWSGGVAHYISSDEEPTFVSDSNEEEEVKELSGSDPATQGGVSRGDGSGTASGGDNGRAISDGEAANGRA